MSKLKIGLITGSWDKKNPSVFNSALKLVDLLDPFATEISWVITNCSGDENRLPEKVDLIKMSLEETYGKPFLKKAFYHLKHQIKEILEVRKLNKIDVFVFAEGARTLLFVFLFTTLFMRKKTILRIDGRTSTNLMESGDKKYKILIVDITERLMYLLAYRIAITHNYILKRCNLQEYQYKICFLPLYIDTTLFKKSKGLNERLCDVGYVGRISIGKGVLEFVESLPIILKYTGGKMLIVGKGNREKQVKELLINDSIQDKVELTGWIEKEELPTYLNDIKELVLPSEREGLPNIVLEAMACGCVVLATAVGGIPSVIKDGETGFIMENNSPECIAENVIRALEYPDLDVIVENARKLIEKKYTYEVAIERYREIFESILARGGEKTCVL